MAEQPQFTQDEYCRFAAILNQQEEYQRDATHLSMVKKVDAAMDVYGIDQPPDGIPLSLEDTCKMFGSEPSELPEKLKPLVGLATASGLIPPDQPPTPDVQVPERIVRGGWDRRIKQAQTAEPWDSEKRGSCGICVRSGIHPSKKGVLCPACQGAGRQERRSPTWGVRGEQRRNMLGAYFGHPCRRLTSKDRRAIIAKCEGA